MKTALFALFLLLAIITSKLPSTTADVVDTDGDILRNGGTYYILPVRRGNGGGLRLAATGNETCPLTVVQSRFESSVGLPARISSPARIAIIHTGLMLNIGFTVLPKCAPSNPPFGSEWTIVQGLPEGSAVKITGYENTVAGSFRIRNYRRDYKLVFCLLSSATCRDLGISIDENRRRRLVVSRDPLIVKFKKVSSSAA